MDLFLPYWAIGTDSAIRMSKRDTDHVIPTFLLRSRQQLAVQSFEDMPKGQQIFHVVDRDLAWCDRAQGTHCALTFEDE